MSPFAMLPRPTDHSIGPADAPVTLVEYADFQCPYCKAAHFEISRLRSAVPAQVRMIFRHFPLHHLHEFAELGAEAAEAAGAQGKFWEMHDLLFEHQEDLGPAGVMALARMLELDIDRFEADLESRRFRARVEEDVRSGRESGVRGTPSFFLNGEKYEGDYSFDSLLDAIHSAPSPHP